jgi:hypothetical protein
MKHITLNNVILSARSQNFIQQLKSLPDISPLKPEAKDIAFDELVTWLHKTELTSATRHRFILESLRASLLADLNRHFSDSEENDQAKKPHWFSKIKLMFLALAGTLLALCYGFDGITSVLGSFAAIPAMTVFGIGVLFSFISIAVFYGIDLVDISKNLGINLRKSNQLLDVLLDEAKQIKKLRVAVNDAYMEFSEDPKKRATLQALLDMLLWRYQCLDEAREAYKTQLNKKLFNAFKWLTDIPTGLFYFAGGFFAGQTFSLAIAGLFLLSVTAGFWPIILASTIVGLAAFSMYWFVQRPGLENFLGRWMGLDKAKIEVFTDPETVSKEKHTLTQLKSKLEHMDELYKQQHHKEWFFSPTPVKQAFRRCRSLNDLSPAQDGLDKGDSNFTLGFQRSAI